MNNSAPFSDADTPIAYNFDFPIGTADERRGVGFPPGWTITNPYANFYYLDYPKNQNPAYHTGLDIVHLEGGNVGAPIYAACDAVVTYSEHRITSWGNLIVTRSRLPKPVTYTALNGTTFTSQYIMCRYGHGLDRLVKTGDIVRRGDVLCHEGNADGRFAYHLHFDMSLTNILLLIPWHWPGADLKSVYDDYIDPDLWIREHHTMSDIQAFRDLMGQVKPGEDVRIEVKGVWTLFNCVAGDFQTIAPPVVDNSKKATVTADSLKVRSAPTTKAAYQIVFNKDTQITVVDSGVDADGYHWWKVTSKIGKDGFVAGQFLDFQ